MMELNGSGTAVGYRFAIIVSRFNEEITEGLLKGARAALEAAHVRSEDITLVRVPGAFEIPVTHVEYIASAVSQGIMDAGAATGIPVTFGVLTTLTDEQAAARAAEGPENKGREAAQAAVEMATLCRHIGEAGLHEH